MDAKKIALIAAAALAGYWLMSRINANRATGTGGYGVNQFGARVPINTDRTGQAVGFAAMFPDAGAVPYQNSAAGWAE